MYLLTDFKNCKGFGLQCLTLKYFSGTKNCPEPQIIKSDSEIGVDVSHMQGLEEKTQWYIAHPSFVYVDAIFKLNTQYQHLIPLSLVIFSWGSRLSSLSQVFIKWQPAIHV